MIETPMTLGLSNNQKEYMNQKRSTKSQPNAEDLAEFILSMDSAPSYISGSDIMFGGIKR